MEILKVNNLTKNYLDFTLNDICFTLPKGSIMGLIGENGAGKTTIIKLLLNLIKRDNGSIEILGLDNIKDELTIKQNIGVVLDESYFHDNLKPKEISIIMRNIYYKWDNNKFLDYIKKFNLPQDKIIKNYSKGGVGIIFCCILLPLVFKFGVEKSRLMMMTVIAIPTVIGYFLNEMGVQMPTEDQLITGLKILPLILLLIIYISSSISCNIYNKKDF